MVLDTLAIVLPLLVLSSLVFDPVKVTLSPSLFISLSPSLGIQYLINHMSKMSIDKAKDSQDILCQFSMLVATLQTTLFLLNRGCQSRQCKERECEEEYVVEFHNEWDGIK